MRKQPKRYFLPDGLRGNPMLIDRPRNEVIETAKRLPCSENKHTVGKPFHIYLVLAFGVTFGLIGCLLVLCEINWETVDPDAIPDYALASAGASIAGQPAAIVYNWKDKWLPEWIVPTDSNPTTVLQPWKSPGECWAFAGQKAKIRIRLSHLIVPKLVTLEHIPKAISPAGNIKSAPKDFAGVDEELLEHMGDFQFKGKGSRQTFLLQPETKLAYPYRVLEFQFKTNHGHPSYTCVYKIRVHGTKFFKF